MALDNVAWKERFVAEHPEWTILFIRASRYFEATRDDPNTIITDRDLGKLMRRVEDATAKQESSG